MKTQPPTNRSACLAAPVAPEDLACGEYVAVLNRIREFPSFMWCGDEGIGSRQEPVRIQLRPMNGGTPLRVEAICLPFVFLKSPTGRFRTADLRQMQLVRLNRHYARQVWKVLRRQSAAPIPRI